MKTHEHQNSLLPAQATSILRRVKSKQGVFDEVQTSAQTLAKHMNFMTAADFPDFRRYIGDGSLENGDELRKLNNVKIYTEWELLALIELGRYYMETQDIPWDDIRWGLN